MTTSTFDRILGAYKTETAFRRVTSLRLVNSKATEKEVIENQANNQGRIKQDVEAALKQMFPPSDQA